MGMHQLTSYFYGVPLKMNHPFISTPTETCKHGSSLMENGYCTICGVAEGTYPKIKLTSLMIAKREFKSFCNENDEYFFGCYMPLGKSNREGVEKVDMLTIDEMIQIQKRYQELGLNIEELGLYSFTSFG